MRTPPATSMTTRSSSAKPRKRKKGRRLRCVTYPTVRFALRGRLHNRSGCPHRKGNGAPFNNPVELSRIGTSALKPHTSSPLGTSRRAIPRGGSQQQSASARGAAQAWPVDSTASARMCNSAAHCRFWFQLLCKPPLPRLDVKAASASWTWSLAS